MTRIAGFEQVAKESRHVGVFMTITCPSRMHATIGKNSARNPRYDGTTPRQAQQYLGKQWSKIRAKLHRNGIHPYGFRVAEPHHYGTPHWHLLVFVPEGHKHQLMEICRHYALEVDGEEPGAQARRFTTIDIDWRKGTAAGYIAKYISKNIDGYGLDADLYGNEAQETVRRVDAWVSTWGIRQFQQIGGPPVGIWRELRKITSQITDSDSLEVARQAADEGDWATYVNAMGGCECRRADQSIQLIKAWCDQPGRYGEPRGEIIIGLCCSLETVEIPRHEWNISYTAENTDNLTNAADDDSYSVSVRRLPQPPDSMTLSAWSSVKNCTLRSDYSREIRQ